MRLWCLKGTQIRNIHSVFAIVEIRGNGTLGYRTMQMFPHPWKCFTHSHKHTHTYLCDQREQMRSLSGPARHQNKHQRIWGAARKDCGEGDEEILWPTASRGGCYSCCTDPQTHKVQQTQNLQNWSFTPQIWCNANILLKYFNSSSKAPDSLAIAVMRIWEYNCIFWIINAKLVGIGFFLMLLLQL